MIYLSIPAALLLLYLLYQKISSYFAGKKVETLKTELKEQKHESDKKVIIADTSYDSFKQLLDKYKKTEK